MVKMDWRRVIGCFYYRAAWLSSAGRCHHGGLDPPVLSRFFFLVLALLLLMEGVESNPGPSSDQGTVNQANFFSLNGPNEVAAVGLDSRRSKRPRDNEEESIDSAKLPRSEDLEIHDVVQKVQHQVQLQIQQVLATHFGELESKLKSMNARIGVSELAVGAIRSTGETQNSRLRHLEQEVHGRNLILFKPTGTQQLEEAGLTAYLNNFVQNTLRVQGVQVSYPRFLFKAREGPSPIIFQVSSISHKIALLRASKCLQGKPTYLAEDLPPRVREARKKLQPWRLRAIERGALAFLRHDELWVDGERVPHPELVDWDNYEPKERAQANVAENMQTSSAGGSQVSLSSSSSSMVRELPVPLGIPPLTSPNSTKIMSEPVVCLGARVEDTELWESPMTLTPVRPTRANAGFTRSTLTLRSPTRPVVVAAAVSPQRDAPPPKARGHRGRFISPTADVEVGARIFDPVLRLRGGDTSPPLTSECALRCAYWNCEGWGRHRDEVRDLARDLDVCAIGETWWRGEPDMIPDGFQLVHAMATRKSKFGRPSGGVSGADSSGDWIHGSG